MYSDKNTLVTICSGLDNLSQAAADFWLVEAETAIKTRGSFHVALTGGTTPQKLYGLFATAEYLNRVDWKNVHIYIGDERYVPYDHPDSNYGMARKLMLEHVPIPETNLHPVQTMHDKPEESAELYSNTLNESVPSKVGNIPQLDLIMLGLGEDGHTASLFPQTGILDEKEKLVAAVFVDKLSAWRVSMTYPLINSARTIMFLVSGDNKAGVVAHVLRQGAEYKYPVQGVNNTAGKTYWFLDESAASQLEN